MKVPFIIYADSECLLGKIDICHNNPEKSSTTKNHKHTASGYPFGLSGLQLRKTG